MSYKQYKTITMRNAGQFDDVVKTHIDYGWTPLGGVAIAYDAQNNLTYAQAMITEPAHEA